MTTLNVPAGTVLEADRLLDEGKTIAAIKAVRDATQCSLIDARNWVYYRAGGVSAQPPALLAEKTDRWARWKLALDMLRAVADGCDVRLLPEQAREVLDERAETLVLLARVREIHRSATTEAGLPASAAPRCVTCKEPAPCATVRALDGEQPS